MSNEILIPLNEAVKRYGKDKRTLQRWAKAGQLLYDVLNPQSRQPTWLIESPEAHHARMMGVV